MMLFLSKFLPGFVFPLGLIWLSILCVLLFGKLTRGSKIVLSIILVLIFISSNRWTAYGLVYSLERQYVPEGELPSADAIVLLGGGTEPFSPPRRTVELNGSGDRVFYAATLYHEGKAPAILSSGGRLPWDADNDSPPAVEMQEILLELGVPEQDIWMEKFSVNTEENARFATPILKEKGVESILLVTSAAHMPRAFYLFNQEGFEVIPAPTDFNVTDSDWNLLWQPDVENFLLGFFPQSSYMTMTTSGLKEYLGRAVAGLLAVFP
jgi:uncharacterized SAM-binding protein YcdF (DUF218 family)